jgi:hypothetical protein
MEVFTRLPCPADQPKYDPTFKLGLHDDRKPSMVAGNDAATAQRVMSSCGDINAVAHQVAVAVLDHVA